MPLKFALFVLLATCLGRGVTHQDPAKSSGSQRPSSEGASKNLNQILRNTAPDISFDDLIEALETLSTTPAPTANAETAALQKLASLSSEALEAISKSLSNTEKYKPSLLILNLFAKTQALTNAELLKKLRQKELSELEFKVVAAVRNFRWDKQEIEKVHTALPYLDKEELFAQADNPDAASIAFYSIMGLPEGNLERDRFLKEQEAKFSKIFETLSEEGKKVLAPYLQATQQSRIANHYWLHHNIEVSENRIAQIKREDTSFRSQMRRMGQDPSGIPTSLELRTESEYLENLKASALALGKEPRFSQKHLSYLNPKMVNELAKSSVDAHEWMAKIHATSQSSADPAAKDFDPAHLKSIALAQTFAGNRTLAREAHRALDAQGKYQQVQLAKSSPELVSLLKQNGLPSKGTFLVATAEPWYNLMIDHPELFDAIESIDSKTYQKQLDEESFNVAGQRTALENMRFYLYDAKSGRFKSRFNGDLEMGKEALDAYAHEFKTIRSLVADEKYLEAKEKWHNLITETRDLVDTVDTMNGAETKLTLIKPNKSKIADDIDLKFQTENTKHEVINPSTLSKQLTLLDKTLQDGFDVVLGGKTPEEQRLLMAQLGSKFQTLAKDITKAKLFQPADPSWKKIDESLFSFYRAISQTSLFDSSAGGKTAPFKALGTSLSELNKNSQVLLTKLGSRIEQLLQEPLSPALREELQRQVGFSNLPDETKKTLIANIGMIPARGEPGIAGGVTVPGGATSASGKKPNK